MSPLTPAQRKAAERDRQRERGLVVVQVWVHPEDRENLARYVKRLNQRRAARTPPEPAQPESGREPTN